MTFSIVEITVFVMNKDFHTLSIKYKIIIVFSFNSSMFYF